MIECFNCGQATVCWDADFSFDDFGLDGDGIVYVMHCANCGAKMEVDDAETEEES